jgi:hypothetical protein
LGQQFLASPAPLLSLPLLPSSRLTQETESTKKKTLAHLNLGGRIAKTVIFAIEVEVVISHGLRSSGYQTAVNEWFFFSLNSMEMTGGVVLERQGSIHHVHKQQK